MVWALLAALYAVMVFFVVALWREIQKRDRALAQRDIAYQRERQQYLDRIMYLSGQPWMLPEVKQDEPSENIDPDTLPYYAEQTVIEV